MTERPWNGQIKHDSSYTGPKIYDATLRIVYGATTTYVALADAIGRPGREDAVMAALARNPLPIVIPCHRVIADDGGLGEYGGDWLDPETGRIIKSELLGREHDDKDTDIRDA